MKILRYLVFLSILSSLVFVIYCQSDEKGFRRWWTSFKAVVIIAASLSGLVSEDAEAQDFNSFKNTSEQVILVGRDSTPNVPSNLGRQGQSPSNFPTSPSGGRQPSRPVTGVNPFRHLGVNPGTGANPGGAGNAGAANYDDESGIPKIPESKTCDYDYRLNRKKKQSAEQCELDENVKDVKVKIVYRIKENPALVREAERAGRDYDAQRSINNLVEQLSLGNRNPGIGTENVFKDVYELRGKNRARVYYREVGGKIEILGKSVKSNQQKVINILKKMYG